MKLVVSALWGCVLFLSLSVVASASNISPLICSNPGSTTASSTDTSISANSCTDFSYAFPNPQPATGMNNWQYGYYNNPSVNSSTVPPSFTFDSATVSSFTMMSPTPTNAGAPNPNGNGTSNPQWWSTNFYDYWTSLDAFGGHVNADLTSLHNPPYCDPTSPTNCSPTGGFDPNPSVNQLAVRRYLVPDYTSNVDITYQVQKDPRDATADSMGTDDYVLLYDGDTVTMLGSVSDPVNMGGSQPVMTITADNVSVHPGDMIDFVMAPMYDSTMSNFADFSSGTFAMATINGPAMPSVPEPTTVGLMAGGLALLAALRRYRS